MELAQALWVILGSYYGLYYKTHAYHWNVEGQDFPQLHKLFDEQYNDLWENIDEIAERIRMLDAYAPMSLTAALKGNRIPDEPGKPTAQGMVETLIQDHDILIHLLNQTFRVADQAGDQAVMDYLAGRLDAHAKMRWMLKATAKRG